MTAKTHAHCKTPGCMEPATFYPHDFAPNVGFCQKHAWGLIKATVDSILDGTHPDLQDDDWSCPSCGHSDCSGCQPHPSQGLSCFV